MAIEHVLFRQIEVKIGGRKIGPLFVGGRFYSVGPVTALRYIEINAALGRLLESRFHQRQFDGVLTELRQEPLGVLAMLVPLLVSDQRVRARDLQKMTRPQFEACWSAFLLQHDFDWIRSHFEVAEPTDANSGPGLGPFHMAVEASAICGGAYTPEDLLKHKPLALLLSILDARADIVGAVPSTTPKSDPATVRAVEQLEIDSGVARFE